MSRIHAQVDIEFPHFVRMGTTAGDLERRDSLGGHRQMVAKVFDATVHSGWIVYAWPQLVLSLHLPSILLLIIRKAYNELAPLELAHHRTSRWRQMQGQWKVMFKYSAILCGCMLSMK
jgi:hypothetical protein